MQKLINGNFKFFVPAFALTLKSYIGLGIALKAKFSVHFFSVKLKKQTLEVSMLENRRHTQDVLFVVSLS